MNKKLIEKYNIPVPRYTSYPPANHFKEGITGNAYLNLIEQSNQDSPENIAIYIHVPFCRKICFYCGCNACTTRDEKVINEYFHALEVEIKKVSSRINKNRKISQVHYGGGTPNAVDIKHVVAINQLLFSEFSFIDDPEIAIECNPAYLDFSYLDNLLQLKFNRFSIGIQDFKNDVLQTVNRAPSAIPVGDIVTYIKEKNPAATINLDFIYGLPGQTKESFLDTIGKAVAIKPDRLVTFSYAHVPWMKKHQEVLEKKNLPSSEEKMKMFLAARDLLLSSGYVPVGLDHYVLPGDELNSAMKNNNLHRNFQGYCTRRTTGQVYAFGVSAITQLEKGYIQNVKEVAVYNKHLEEKKLPVEKGLVLNGEQKLIRDAITNIMCNKYLDFLAIANKHGITLDGFIKITGFDKEEMKPLQEDGLVEYFEHGIKITATGGLFIRNIAALFDPAFKSMKNRYSKSV